MPALLSFFLTPPPPPATPGDLARQLHAPGQPALLRPAGGHADAPGHHPVAVGPEPEPLPEHCLLLAHQEEADLHQQCVLVHPQQHGQLGGGERLWA